MDDKWVQRRGAPPLRVAIVRDQREGDYEAVTPSLILESADGAGDLKIFLTWKEARDLASALIEIEEVARCG